MERQSIVRSIRLCLFILSKALARPRRKLLPPARTIPDTVKIPARLTFFSDYVLLIFYHDSQLFGTRLKKKINNWIVEGRQVTKLSDRTKSIDRPRR